MASALLLAAHGLRGQGANFKVGPVYFDLVGSAGATWSSNITSSPARARPDVMLFTRLNANGDWAVSKFNDLTFNFGLEYRKYFNNPQLDSQNNFLTITPDSHIQFTIFAGSVRFLLSDDIRFSSDPTDSVAVDPGTSQVNYNVLSYSRLHNDARITAIWQMNPLWTGTASFTRTDVIPLDSFFDTTDRTEYTLQGSLDRVINSKLTAGVYGSYFWNRYKVHFQNDSQGVSYGVQSTWQVSQAVSLNARYGWRVINFRQNGRNHDSSDFQGTDFSIQLAHTASSLYTHRLAYSRVIDYGFVSNTTVTDNVIYSFTYKGFKRADINGDITWQNGRDSGGLSNETYNRFIFHIGLGYALSRKLTWQLDYTDSIKNSSRTDREYSRNDISVLLRYDF